MLKEAATELAGLLREVLWVSQEARGRTGVGFKELAVRIGCHLQQISQRAATLSGDLSLRHVWTRIGKGGQGPEERLGLIQRHRAARERIRAAVQKLIQAQDFGAADMVADSLRTLNSQAVWLEIGGWNRIIAQVNEKGRGKKVAYALREPEFAFDEPQPGRN